MSENKFTPGPWDASQDGYNWRFEGGYNGRIKAENGDIVFAGPSSFKALRGKSEEQAIANANLIAAAPELLEALEDAIEQIYDNHILERKIEKAIAKAKGEL